MRSLVLPSRSRFRTRSARLLPDEPEERAGPSALVSLDPDRPSQDVLDRLVVPEVADEPAALRSRLSRNRPTRPDRSAVLRSEGDFVREEESLDLDGLSVSRDEREGCSVELRGLLLKR